MFGVHFEVSFDGTNLWIRDLKSVEGTLLNGIRFRQSELKEGDVIVAGQTTFMARLGYSPHAAASRRDRVLPVPLVGAVLDILRAQAEPLYGLFDAARNEQVLRLLKDSDEECESLYEGFQSRLLAQCAPYLVRLPADSLLLESMVRCGWGDGWGLYLTSRLSFKAVRRHFRHFLIVTDEVERELYFRFYDPRVLRVFLPTCTPMQAKALFEGIGTYLVEGEDTTSLIRFVREEAGTRREVRSLGT
jgi:hypothetical protein